MSDEDVKLFEECEAEFDDLRWDRETKAYHDGSEWRVAEDSYRGVGMNDYGGTEYKVISESR